MSFTLAPQHHVHILKHLLDVASKTMNSRIPMASRIALQGIEHNRQYDMPMLRHKRDNIVIVPQEQRPLCYLHRV